MDITEADWKKINDLSKKAADLLRFKKLLETVGFYAAVLELWSQVDESIFGPIDFWQWLGLWREAPLEHPLKYIAPERMALQAEEELEKWKLVWGKSRPYTKLAEQAEAMVTKLETTKKEKE